MSENNKYAGIQEIVDNYRTLSIIIKKNDRIYETEIYNKGVKLFIGKDEILILSLSRALQAIFHFIDTGKINRHTELTASELTSWIEVLGEQKEENILATFISSHHHKL